MLASLDRPILVMVSDRRRYGAMDDLACDQLVEACGRAAQAGVDIIQIRERDLTDRQLIALTRRVLDVSAGSPAHVLVNERSDIALAAGAHGVHLPAAAIDASRVRSIVPEGFVIGRSVHSEAEAVEVERRGGCDYVIFGTVFPSASKAPGHQVAGVAALGAVCSRVGIPVLAIGGMTLERAGAVAAAGAAGLAAIGLFAGADATAPSGARTAHLGTLVDRVRQVRGAFRGGGAAVGSPDVL